MTNFPMVAEVSFFMGFLAVIWVLCAILLCLIVLIQKGKGGGLSSAFGGAGGGAGLLGTKTGDFLTWVTISLVAVFFILAIVLGKFYRPIKTVYRDEATPAVTQTGLPLEGDSDLDPAKIPEGTDAEVPAGETTNVPVDTEKQPDAANPPVTE